MPQHILITGGAGFIGSHLADKLLLCQPDTYITAVDNFDDFYDPRLKHRNIAAARQNPRYRLLTADICQPDQWQSQVAHTHFDAIVHLAAKAGVRPSISRPQAYYEVNVRGTQVLLDWAQRNGVKRFIFGSSSSVYGINPKVPWVESDTDFMPISPYAATKIAAEMLGHVYTHLYGMQFIALRFFSVYGERQRPDLAINKFVQAIEGNESIPFFGNGSISRDYTHVSDITDGIIAALGYRDTNYEIINLGNGHAISLSEMVRCLGEVMECEVRIAQLPEQAGDVPQTCADIDKARRLLGYQPRISLTEGLRQYVAWHQKNVDV